MEWRKNINKMGNSSIIIVPKDLLKYLGLENGKEFVLTADKGKHGRFASFWNEEQQDKETPQETPEKKEE